MKLVHPISLYLILIISQVIGIYFYTSGFFIVREQVNRYSDRLKDSTRNLTCPFSQQIDKMIFVIIDAMRFDFAYQPESESVSQRDTYFLNNFPIIKQMLEQEFERSLLFKMHSDPPTVTLQRIKGFTTGNLPSYIDIKDNFYASESTEDNILHQLKSNGYKIFFAGDDTWLGIYPKLFDVSYPFDSFNVKDIHTVDNGVISKLMPAITQRKFQFILAHFLGVDHVGHTYQSNSIQMKDKLQQLSAVINSTIERLDKNTLLLVISDHGMTEDGNHGGSSEDETNTFLFAYCKRGFRYKVREQEDPSFSKILKFNSQFQKNVDQIDIPATVSRLMGVPIPFNSLGMFIPDIAVNFGEAQNSASEELAELLAHTIYNYGQIIEYLKEIQENYRKFETKLFNSFLEGYRRYAQLTVGRNLTDSEKIIEIHKIQKDIAYIKEVCRKAWNEFNLFQMCAGKVIMISCIVMSINLIGFLQLRIRYPSIQYGSLLGRLGCTGRNLASGVMVVSLLLHVIFGVSCSSGVALYLVSFLAVLNYHLFRGFKESQTLIKIKSGQILQNILFQKSTSTFIFWLLQIGRGYMLFSVRNLRNEDQSLWLLILLSGVAYAYEVIKYHHEKAGAAKLIGSILLIIALLHLISYYDTTTLRKYTEVQVKFEFFSCLMNSVYVKIILPAGGLAYFLHRFLHQNINQAKAQGRALKNIRPQVFQILVCINTFLTYAYLIAAELSKEFWPEYIPKNLLPQTIYIISGLLALLSLSMLQFRLTTQINLLFLSLIHPILIIIGKNAMSIFFFYTVVLKLLLDVTKGLRRISAIHLHTLLPALSIYIWFVTGHRCQIAALHITSAYVGFEEFNLYLSGFLLCTNTFAAYIITLLLLPAMQQFTAASSCESKSLVESEHPDEKTQKYRFIQTSILFQLLLLVSITCTMINCTYHKNALLLIEDFTPKYLFDAATLLVVSFILLLANAAYWTRNKI